MSRRAIQLAGLLSFVMMMTTASAEDDIDNGKTLYKRYCVSCHGQYGEVSNDVIPNILGQYPGYMLSQLSNFVSPDPKTGRRGVAGDLKRAMWSHTWTASTTRSWARARRRPRHVVSWPFKAGGLPTTPGAGIAMAMTRWG
jgi:hypothetical protein